MRERTGELRQNKDKTWMARVRGDDGKRTEWTSLCTSDETLAKEKLQHWLESGITPSQAPRERFRDVSVRFMKKYRATPGRKAKAVSDRQSRLDRIILPRIGDMEVGRIATKDVASVLDMMAASGAAKGTCNTALADMSRIFAMARREGAIVDNPALDVGLPEEASVDDRQPIVLDDHEIVAFRKRGFDTELDMMVLFCCELGGHRTSDLHAASWDDTDTFAFEKILVRRPKTTDQAGRLLEERRRRERPSAGARRATRAYERVEHKLKGTVRQALIAWWKKAGCPRRGPIFPVRKGKRLGQYKGDNISYAQPFRDALWAEGIVRPMEGYEQAVGEERRKFCALQTDTLETRAVDFHSLRRWFATRMANAGLNEQDAMDLTGHSVASTHARYRGPRLIEVPDHALLDAPHDARPPGDVPPHGGGVVGGQGSGVAAAQVPPPEAAAPPGAIPPQVPIDAAALAAVVAAAVAQTMAAMGHAPNAPVAPAAPEKLSLRSDENKQGLPGSPFAADGASKPIDPSFGSHEPRFELRAIRGGKK